MKNNQINQNFINMYKGYMFREERGYLVARNVKTKDKIEGFTVMDMPELKSLIDKKTMKN